MNKDDRALLVGMVMGDGYLTKPKGASVSLCITHAERFSDYLECKANMLHSILGGKRPVVHQFNNNGYPGVYLTKADSYFRILRGWIYKDNIKVISEKLLNLLNDEALAIWWMDDGSLYMKRRFGKVHAREGILSTYTDISTTEAICKWFSEKYNLNARPVHHKGKYRIRFNTSELKKLILIIKPYVVADSMQYKVDMNYPLTAEHEPPTTSHA